MRKLPTSIEILGNTITVEHVPDLIESADRVGDWDVKQNRIRVQSLGQGYPNDVVFEAFHHETMHAILDLTGHHELSADEAFVERLGQALYQAEKTRSYG